MKKIRRLSMILTICSMVMINTICVFAADNSTETYEVAESCGGIICDATDTKLIVPNSLTERASCTHIPCNRVTDTVWQHVHTGIAKCDVYTATATWCKCCDTILSIDSDWVYSYTHYGCTM